MPEISEDGSELLNATTPESKYSNELSFNSETISSPINFINPNQSNSSPVANEYSNQTVQLLGNFQHFETHLNCGLDNMMDQSYLNGFSANDYTHSYKRELDHRYLLQKLIRIKTAFPINEQVTHTHRNKRKHIQY